MAYIYMDYAMRIRVFGHERTAKAQIRLPIRTESFDTREYMNEEQMTG